MFGLFKKKILKTEEEKRAESLPRTKKVQFEPSKMTDFVVVANLTLRKPNSFLTRISALCWDFPR